MRKADNKKELNDVLSFFVCFKQKTTQPLDKKRRNVYNYLTLLGIYEGDVDDLKLYDKMNRITQTKNWRDLVGLIDDGYRGIYVLLRLIHESQTGLTAGELAKKAGVSTARIASALNAMERRKYVIRQKARSDARKVIVSLTEEGVAALDKRKSEISETLMPMFQNLTENETETLFALLGKLLN